MKSCSRIVGIVSVTLTTLLMLAACGHDESTDFSTEPIKFTLQGSGRVFSIPRNYFAPNLVDAPDEEQSENLGFHLFLPDYDGYTVESAEGYPNQILRWGDKIWVMGMAPQVAWRDPEELFEEQTKGLHVFYEEYGLRCYGMPG